jgi:hypothetical protein
VNGREQIEAALSAAGTPQIPAVICYGGIFTRDHWGGITSRPWWYQHAPDLESQMVWRRELVAKVGQDWLEVPLLSYSKKDREALAIETRGERVYLVDQRNGKSRQLAAPSIGGDLIDVRPPNPPATADGIDQILARKRSPGQRWESALASGQGDLASQLLSEFGAELFPICYVDSPLESCFYTLWGFEEGMINIATRPELVAYACDRFLARAIDEVRLAARLGVAGVFIEDTFTDMIHPDAFAALNVPYAQRLVEEIRQLGLKSIYYFCGDPAGKWDLLMSIGADALSLEESKKRFVIDIEDVVEKVAGRCALLGNLDAIGVLQDASEEQLRAEIARQIAAGRRNGDRFIMSIGSPVTPGTPVERVRLYCDLAHELGAAR